MCGFKQQAYLAQRRIGKTDCFAVALISKYLFRATLTPTFTSFLCTLHSALEAACRVKQQYFDSACLLVLLFRGVFRAFLLYFYSGGQLPGCLKHGYCFARHRWNDSCALVRNVTI